MIDRELLAYLRYAHGFFNLCMMALFFAQARIGFRIRKARKAGAPIPFDDVRRHRKAGPVFALWGSLGFLVGIVVVLLDKGRIFAYPPHFVTGFLIVTGIAVLYLLSKRIKGTDPTYRNPHAYTGTAVLMLYVVQCMLGLGILF
ncbi:MAG: DUF4079 family protein [Nitrospiraceae bacterium]|nr:DUF4079 family protein [Nitrospiraceae bacterium]